MTMEEAASSLSLSKNVLAMKFMQRSRAKGQQTEVPELQTEEKWKYDAPSDLNTVARIPIVEKVSLSSCRSFSYGRVSYQGFNEDIEKLMRHRKKPIEKPDYSQEASISDEAMASSLARTVGNKFSKKRQGKKRHAEPEEGEIGDDIGDVDEEQLDIPEDAAIRIQELKRRVNELLANDD